MSLAYEYDAWLVHCHHEHDTLPLSQKTEQVYTLTVIPRLSQPEFGERSATGLKQGTSPHLLN